MEHSSYTWNFEGDTFAVNQDYVLRDGCVMTKDCFVPKIIIPMNGLHKRFDEFVAVLGYEEVDLKAELPEDLKSFSAWIKKQLNFTIKYGIILRRDKNTQMILCPYIMNLAMGCYCLGYLWNRGDEVGDAMLIYHSKVYKNVM